MDRQMTLRHIMLSSVHLLNHALPPSFRRILAPIPPRLLGCSIRTRLTNRCCSHYSGREGKVRALFRLSWLVTPAVDARSVQVPSPLSEKTPARTDTIGASWIYSMSCLLFRGQANSTMSQQSESVWPAIEPLRHRSADRRGKSFPQNN